MIWKTPRAGTTSTYTSRKLNQIETESRVSLAYIQVSKHHCHIMRARLRYMETGQEEEEYRVVTWVSKFVGIYMVEWNSVEENSVTKCEYNGR